MSRLSVLLPTYQSITFLPACVDSILNQTFSDFEMICVDAGSTDGTAELLASYAAKDSRVQVLHSEKKSYGYQLNLGLDRASGEYIGIVESDDFLAPEMYERLMTLSFRGNADLVKGSYTSFFHAGKEIAIPLLSPIPAELHERLLTLAEHPELRLADPIHIWSGIYRREFLREKRIRFHESPGASYQDTSFFALTDLLAETAVFTDDAHYHYRLDNANSSVHSAEKIYCVVEEFHYIEKELKKRAFQDEELRKRLSRFRLDSYLWNLERLPAKSAPLFLDAIQQELTEIEESLSSELSEEMRQKLLILKDRTSTREQVLAKRTEALTLLQERIEAGKWVVFVSAGRRTETLLLATERANYHRVSVCDNFRVGQRTKNGEHPILSVEDAVSTYPDAAFLIANKEHGEVLREQLLSLGVSEEAIAMVRRPPLLMDLVNFCPRMPEKRERMDVGDAKDT